MPTRANRAGSVRRTETENAVMTTLASPTQGDASVLSMWQVEMRQGRCDPEHAVDSEQIWHVTRGELAITIEHESVRLAAGDTLVVPEVLSRRVTALTDATAVVCGFGDAIVATRGEAGSTRTRRCRCTLSREGGLTIIIRSDKFIRMDNELYALTQRLFVTVVMLSLVALGIAAVVGGSGAVWVRGIIVVVISALLIVFARRAHRGSRGAYRRMRLMTTVAPIAIVAIIAIPHDGFPAWMKVEQAFVGVLLAAAAAMVSRKPVRRAYLEADADSGSLAR